MGTGVGRNSPCPCGSGRKYKICCLRAAPEAVFPTGSTTGDAPETPPAGRFRFEPGSYGAPGGVFLPSIACLRREPGGGWAYHFVLVVPDSLLEAEETASLEAGNHLLQAFRGSAAPEAIAERLKAFGYVSVSGFEIAKDVKRHTTFRPAPDASE
jgi:hypothetical protein